MTIEVLPGSGIITISALSEFLGTKNTTLLMERLSTNGIPILKLSSKSDQRLVRLEDLRKMK